MHHAATQDFNPARMFADVAAAAAAYPAIDIHFGAWFSKREIGRPETHFDICTKHFLYKKIKCLFKIRKRNMLVDIEAFGLVEETMSPGANGFISIYPPRTDDADRRLLAFHHSCLHAARMRAQQPVRILRNIKCILHVTGRMIFGQVQGSKVVPVIFNFGSFCNGKTESSENVHDLVSDEADGVPAAKGQFVSRQAQRRVGKECRSRWS